MKLPRDLSGAALIQVRERGWGYRRVRQVGSHITLETEEPTPHRVAIPAHRALRIGTLNAILRTVAKHKGVSREEVLRGG